MAQLDQIAARGGWVRQKIDGWVWLARNARWVWARRRQLQGERTVGDGVLVARFVAKLDPANYSLPSLLGPLNLLLSVYWAAARKLL